MRSISCSGVLALVAGAAARADEPPLTPERAAAAVAKAWESKDEGALAELAKPDNPDPWLVADALLGQGGRDAASAFATAAPRRDVDKLAAFVADWRAGEAEALARDALARGNAALLDKRWPDALAAFGDVPAGVMPFLAVRIRYGQGLALSNAGRSAEATARFAAVAAEAEALGWLSRAALAWRESARAAGADRTKALEKLQKLLQLEVKRQDPRALAGAWNAVGLVQADLGRWDEAVAAHTEVLGILTEPQDRAWQADTLNFLANAEVRRGRTKEAREATERSLALSEPMGLSAPIARSRELQGMADMADGRPDLAERSYRAALKAAGAAHDPSLEARMLYLVGVALADCDEHERALEPLLQALEAVEKLDEGQGPRVALARAGYARSLAVTGKLDEARPLADRAVHDAPPGNRSARGMALWASGTLLRREGKAEDAVKALTAAAADLEAAREFDDSQRVAVEISQAWLLKGDLAEARKAADAALDGARRVRNALALPPALAVSARVRLAQGEPKEALALAKQAREAYAARHLAHGVSAMDILIGEIEAALPR